MAFKIAEEDYEVQYFGFVPSEFNEEVREVVIGNLADGLENMESQMKQVFPELSEEIDHGTAVLRQNTDDTFNKTMQKLENHLLDKLLKIPEHVLLPSDAEQETKATQQDINLLNTEIEGLKMQLKNEKFMQGKLKAELKDIDKVTAAQENMLSGTIGSDAMIEMDNAKEKLVFMGSNVRKLVWAVKKVEQVTEKIHQNEQIGLPQHTDILFENNFE